MYIEYIDVPKNQWTITMDYTVNYNNIWNVPKKASGDWELALSMLLGHFVLPQVRFEQLPTRPRAPEPRQPSEDSEDSKIRKINRRPLCHFTAACRSGPAVSCLSSFQHYSHKSTTGDQVETIET